MMANSIRCLIPLPKSLASKHESSQCLYWESKALPSLHRLQSSFRTLLHLHSVIIRTASATATCRSDNWKLTVPSQTFGNRICPTNQSPRYPAGSRCSHYSVQQVLSDHLQGSLRRIIALHLHRLPRTMASRLRVGPCLRLRQWRKVHGNAHEDNSPNWDTKSMRSRQARNPSTLLPPNPHLAVRSLGSRYLQICHSRGLQRQ